MAATPVKPRPRLGFIDVARSIAMLLMVQGHVVDNLLADQAKATTFFQTYWLIRGVTAPLFFFLSGFALVVASESAWNEYGRLGPRLFGRLRRTAILFLFGCFFQMPRWSGPALTSAEWQYLFRSGVLQCIAVSMLLFHGLISLTRGNKRAFTLMALPLALVILALGPVLDESGIHLPSAAALFLRTETGSLFPLVPWVSHCLLGSVFARFYLDSTSIRTPRRLGLLIGSFAVSMLCAGILWNVLAPTTMKGATAAAAAPSIILAKTGGAWLILGATALLVGAAPSSTWLRAISSRALSVYVAHLFAIYGFFSFPGLVQRLGPTLGLAQVFTLGPLLLAACVLFLVGLDWLLQRTHTAFAAPVAKDVRNQPESPAP